MYLSFKINLVDPLLVFVLVASAAASSSTLSLTLGLILEVLVSKLGTHSFKEDIVSNSVKGPFVVDTNLSRRWSVIGFDQFART